MTNGHVQSFDQPSFPPITLSGFKFAIVTTVTFDNSVISGIPEGRAATTGGLFGLYFKDEFIHVRQELDNAYYAANVFRNCVLMYSGGKTQFAKSNQVIDSDLEIAGMATQDSPEVKQLLHDFTWRNVRYAGNSKLGAKVPRNTPK